MKAKYAIKGEKKTYKKRKLQSRLAQFRCLNSETCELQT